MYNLCVTNRVKVKQTTNRKEKYDNERPLRYATETPETRQKDGC